MARSDGSVFKICRCRDPYTRKPLGNSCPKLRRANRAWSTHHGQWALFSARYVKNGCFAFAASCIQRIACSNCPSVQ